MRRLLFLLLTLASFGYAAAHPAALIHNIPNRTTVSLDGPWQAIVDPYETGLNARFYLNAKPKDKHELLEYDFDKSDVLNVPGDGTRRRRSCFFTRARYGTRNHFPTASGSTLGFSSTSGPPITSLGSISTGRRWGEHEGGFTPFNFEITDRIREGSNFLVAEVNNARRRDGVPSINTDGGTTEDSRATSCWSKSPKPLFR